VSAVLAVSRTAAQTRPTDPDRKYPLPTYAEDWRFLSDPDRHADPWDRFKYVPLADGTFVSFGGEARETYERFGHENFGLSLPSPNGYLLQRYLLHADIHVGSRLRLWTELNSSFENGRVGGPRPVVDVDKLDLHQEFVEFEITQRSDISARIDGFEDGSPEYSSNSSRSATGIIRNRDRGAGRHAPALNNGPVHPARQFSIGLLEVRHLLDIAGVSSPIFAE
jgi:hypothetical protein